MDVFFPLPTTQIRPAREESFSPVLGDMADTKEGQKDGRRISERWREVAYLENTGSAEMNWIHLAVAHWRKYGWGQKKDKAHILSFLFIAQGKPLLGKRKWSYIGSCDPLSPIHALAMTHTRSSCSYARCSASVKGKANASGKKSSCGSLRRDFRGGGGGSLRLP